MAFTLPCVLLLSCVALVLCYDGSIQSEENLFAREPQALNRNARMTYLKDVRSDRIWIVLQRSLKWARNPQYTFVVTVSDKATGDTWVAQRPITWNALDTPIPDGPLANYNKAVLVLGPDGEGLQADHEYTVHETVRSGDYIIFTQSKDYTTKPAPVLDEVNQPSHADLESDCEYKYVCRSHDPNVWFDPIE